MWSDWKEKLSVLTCEYYFDGFHGIEKLQVKGEKLSVYIFDGFYGGFNTIWGDVLLNKLYLEEGMEKAKERILLHEMQHRKESTLLQAIIGPLQMLLHPLAISLASVISSILIVDILFNPDLLDFHSGLGDSLTLLISLGLLYLISILSSYISELKTNLVVMDQMGVQNYNRGFEQSMEKFPEPNLVGKVSLRLSHPSPEIVEKVYKLFYQN